MVLTPGFGGATPERTQGGGLLCVQHHRLVFRFTFKHPVGHLFQNSGDELSRLRLFLRRPTP